MKRSTLLVSAFLILALFLAACGPSDEGEIPSGPSGVDGTLGDPAPGEIPGLGTDTAPGENPETGSELSTPLATESGPSLEDTPIATATEADQTETETSAATPTSGNETPGVTQSATGTDTDGLRGAQVIPDTGREDATVLSELLGYQVVDQNGNTMGTVDDFVLNLCEAHIVYVVLEADPSLELENGNLVVFPYEIVTLQEGVIDVDQRVITVQVDAEQFAAGPSMGERLDLTTTDWEAEIRTHWSEVGRLSNLSTDCSVPAQTETDAGDTDNSNTNYNSNTNDNDNNNDNGNTDEGKRLDITRIAYATEVLDMQVMDGNGNWIGEVEEVVEEPESGWLAFTAVQTDDGLVLVPFGALNLDAAEDGTAQDLVLLVEADVLQNAPTVDNLPSDGWEENAFQYWSQHVPMTREELP